MGVSKALRGLAGHELEYLPSSPEASPAYVPGVLGSSSEGIFPDHGWWPGVWWVPAVWGGPGSRPKASSSSSCLHRKPVFDVEASLPCLQHELCHPQHERSDLMLVCVRLKSRSCEWENLRAAGWSDLVPSDSQRPPLDACPCYFPLRAVSTDVISLKYLRHLKA